MFYFNQINYDTPIIQIQKIWRGKIIRMRKKKGLEEFAIADYLLKKGNGSDTNVLEIYSSGMCELDLLSKTP